jgi:hypothetical protein
MLCAGKTRRRDGPGPDESRGHQEAGPESPPGLPWYHSQSSK